MQCIHCIILSTFMNIFKISCGGDKAGCAEKVLEASVGTDGWDSAHSLLLKGKLKHIKIFEELA